MARDASRVDRAILVRWVRDLLADRRSRSALLQAQTRRLVYARNRLNQAAAYLAGLLRAAEEEASAAWPGKQPCPHCGAPTARVGAVPRAQGHAVVHEHPDGTRCSPASAGVAGATRPANRG